jgi:hypothetical protein
MTQWRGFYCEHYNGKVLLWGPDAQGQIKFLGSARSPSELWGALERSAESEEAVRFEGGQLRQRELSYAKRKPDLPADRAERDQAIEEHIQSQGVTKPRASPRPKSKSKSKPQPTGGLTLSDLDL